MKTKKFIKRVKELGYYCFTNGSYIFISKGYPWIATIALHRMYCMELWTNDNKLGELCMEYARTPIDEREEEEKFYLQKMEIFYDADYNEELAFLNVFTDDGYFMLNDSKHGDGYKTQFTQKEIDDIKKKFNTDLEEFEQIEVGE